VPGLDGAGVVGAVGDDGVQKTNGVVVGRSSDFRVCYPFFPPHLPPLALVWVSSMGKLDEDD
jgi:hypothetical protein